MTLGAKKAMLLAAGLGTRMRPLTDHIPKPLLPVAGKTLLDRALDWFAAAGVGEVIVNSHYKAELLETHLQQRSLLGKPPRTPVIREAELLETGGGVKNALPHLGHDAFFSANSDTICIDGSHPALARLEAAWDDEAMDALLLVHPVEAAIGYEGRGDFFLSERGDLRRRTDAAEAPYVFTGVQLLHPRLFHQAPEGAFSLNRLYDRNRQADGTLSRVKAVVHDGQWLHVGDPQGLAAAERWLERH